MLPHYQTRQMLIRGSNSYSPGERFPETLTRHMMTESGMIQQVQLADGSFYPTMLFDIPNRAARVYGSPSTHSVNSAETAPHPDMMTIPLSAAHVAAHHHPGYVQPHSNLPIRAVRQAVRRAVRQTVSCSLYAGTVLDTSHYQEGLNLECRWATSPPPMSSPVPGGSVSDAPQPHYDTIEPRAAADCSSFSALSLKQIAGLTPGNSSGLGSTRLRVPCCL